MSQAVNAERPADGLRLRRCLDPTCNTLFTLCAKCDRGQRYCSEACRRRMRQAQLRAAGRRYQASEVGKQNHRRRQHAYRQRASQRGVTHQGPTSITVPRALRPVYLTRCAMCGRQNHWMNPFYEIPRRRRGSRRRWRSAQVQISTFSRDR